MWLLLVQIAFQSFLVKCANENQDDVQILAVSTNKNLHKTPLTLSEFGGNNLYIQVQGLDRYSGNNKVLIGYSDCPIQQLDYDAMTIICQTTSVQQDDELIIKVEGKSKSICTLGKEYCQVSLSSQFSPILVQITPAINFAGKEQIVKVNKNLTIDGSGDYGIFLNDYGYSFLSRSDFSQHFERYSSKIPSMHIFITKFSSSLDTSTYLSLQVKTDEGITLNIPSYSSVPYITGLSTNIISPNLKELEIYGYHLYNFEPACGLQVFIGEDDYEANIVSLQDPLKNRVIIQIILPDLAQFFTSEKKLYFGSGGVFYTLYNIDTFLELTSDVLSFRKLILESPEKLKDQILFDGLYPSLDYLVQSQHNTAQYIRGFFRAPLTGNHKFFLSSSGNATFHISMNKQTIFSNSTVFLKNSTGAYRNYWKNNLQTSFNLSDQISEINLEQNGLYFIEVFNVNEGNKEGFLTISVQLEGETDYCYNSLSPQTKTSIISLKTSYTAVKEIIEIQIFNQIENNLLQGSYKIQFQNAINTNTYYISQELSLQSLSQDVKYAIESNSPYQVSVSSKKLNYSGQIIHDNSADFAGYAYTIIFDSYRGIEKFRTLPELTQSTIEASKLKFKVSIIKIPKGPITGTFQLFTQGFQFKMPDGSLDLPYDVEPSIINSQIQLLLNTQSIYWCQGRAQDGRICYFRTSSDNILTFQDQIQTFTIASKLESESSDVIININYEIQSLSNFFEPIPTGMLQTYYYTPQVFVQMSNTIIGCEMGKCSLSFDTNQIFNLQNFTITDTFLHISLNQPQDIAINVKDIQVSFAGAECYNQNLSKKEANFYELQCELEQLNGKIIKEAGSKLVPLITHKLFGEAKIQSEVASIDIDLVIEQIQPEIGSPYGGTVVTLSGTGFPKNQNSVFTLKMGNSNLKLLKVNNQEIQFETKYFDGSEKSYQIILSFNEKIAQCQFNYTFSVLPQITNLEYIELFQNFSGPMKIFGSNLGDKVEEIQIFLKPVVSNFLTQLIPLEILSANSSQIEVFIRPINAGNYSLKYINLKYGALEKIQGHSNQFINIKSFEVYLLDGVSLPQISLYGGLMLKIVGGYYIKYRTFIFIQSEQCLIDEALSNASMILCNLKVSADSNQEQKRQISITNYFNNGTIIQYLSLPIANFKSAVTPLLLNYPNNIINLNNDDFEVSSESEIIFSNSNTHFQRELGFFFYRQNLNTKQLILQKRKVYKPGDVENLTLTNLLGKVWVRFEGLVTITIEAQVKNNTINYTIPNLPQGDYYTFVYTINGNIDKKWITEIPFAVSNISEIFQNGARIKLDGVGFNLERDLNIVIGTKQCSNVEVIDYHVIYCDCNQQFLESTTQIYVTQVSSTNTILLFNNQSKQISKSSYTISQIFVNDKQQFQSQQNTLDLITGQIKFKIVGITENQAAIKLGNIFSKPILKQSNYETIFDQLPIGKYEVIISCNNQTAVYLVQPLYLNVLLDTQSSFTVQPQTSNYLGGQNITFTGNGFGGEKTKIDICGSTCKILNISYSILTCEIPQLRIESLSYQYKSLFQKTKILEINDLLIFGESEYQIKKLFDKKQSTYYQSTSKSTCSVEFNSFKNQQIKLQYIRFSTLVDQNSDYSSLNFFIKQDESNWQPIKYQQNLRFGWNNVFPQIEFVKGIKFEDSTESGKSACQISEIQIIGSVLSDYSPNNPSDEIKCNATIFVDQNEIMSIKDAVIYSNQIIVNTVFPKYGDFLDQKKLLITGKGFLQNKTIVLIDKILCQIITLNDTTIKCKSGIKDASINEQNGLFEVIVNGQSALTNQTFKYVQRWSRKETWGGWIPQMKSALLIESNQVILLDVRYIQLDKLMVEGTLIFSDELDIYFESNQIIVNEGKIIIGTEENPYQHQAQIFIANGVDYYHPQVLKSLTCYKCQLDIHGLVKNPSWTLLDGSALKGSVQINLIQAVNWQVGDKIMISSDKSEEVEYRKITKINENFKTLELNQPLDYNHINSESNSNIIEVAVITRNIKIFGSREIAFMGNIYGQHILVLGTGFEGTAVRISYAEFSKGGQQYDGQLYYPIKFSSNSDMFGSYLVGNYFHNNFGPCITIDGTNQLLIKDNVLLNNDGHGVFLVTGTEINNIIEMNYVSGIFPTNFYQNSALKPASFWVSNLRNKVINNRAVDSLGIGYYVKINAEQFCLNSTFISGFENNFARNIAGFALVVDIEPHDCQGTRVTAQLFNNFQVWNNLNADILILSQMKEQYYKAKFFYNSTESIGLLYQFSSNYFLTEQSCVFTVNHTLSKQFQVKRSSQIVNYIPKLSQMFQVENCKNNDWFYNDAEKSVSVCLSKEESRVFDELIIFNVEEAKIKKLYENEFYGSSSSDSNQNRNSQTQGGSNIDDTIQFLENNGDENNDQDELEEDEVDVVDEGQVDEGQVDEGQVDGGQVDEGQDDEGQVDEGQVDEGQVDGGQVNEGQVDEGQVDQNDPNNNTQQNTDSQSNTSNQGENQYINSNSARNWSDCNAWQEKRCPYENENVVIEEVDIVFLDINPPKLRKITILGQLIFSETSSIRTLLSEEININSTGLLKIGTLNKPFHSSAVINTNSINLEENQLFDQPRIEIVSNNVVTAWSRLLGYAYQNTTTIEVSECENWKIGDQIVIATSSPDPSQNENNIISNIEGCLITIQNPLLFDHFGASDITIKQDTIGQLDMRTVVLFVSRKIIISSLDSSCLLNLKGPVILKGIQFINCGNQDSSGVLLSGGNSNITTIINDCSFHKFIGQMLKIEENKNLIIKNNIFYQGIQQLVELKNYEKIKFNNNALVYVQKSIYKQWAVFGSFIQTELSEMDSQLQDFSKNVGVGSEDAGFYLLSSSCKSFDSYSFNNIECSSAINSCFVIKQFDSNCDYVGQLSAFNSQIGIMYSIVSEQMKIGKIILAENKINIIIKGTSTKQIKNEIYFENSYITAVARPNCQQCYNSSLLSQNCKNTLGMQLATLSTFTFSLIQENMQSNQYDMINSNEQLDLRVYIENVKFDQFKISYPEMPYCQYNSVFRQHPQAYDASGRHYLKNSPCQNCEFDALLYNLRDSDYSQLGLLGGCGSMECTGQKNILIQDETGDFFGQIGQAIANNTYFGQNSTLCKYQKSWNGYWCDGNKISILNFMSIAPDQAKRLFSPIKLSENNVDFNILNSFYEWNWAGTIPQNTRESKFVGLIVKNKSITISNAGINPTSSMFWLSSSKQDKLDYQIITWQFQQPQVIQIVLNDEVVLPGMTSKSKHINLTEMTNQCGSNNYFAVNQTIEFVLTNEEKCVIEVYLRNYVQVQTIVAISGQFNSSQFLAFLREQYGGSVASYYIFSVSKSQRRFLNENLDNQLIQVDWGYLDQSEIGTDEAKQTVQNLIEFSDKIQDGVSLPSNIGTLVSQKSSVLQITELNYTSSEEQAMNPFFPDQQQNPSNQANTNNGNNSASNNTDIVVNPMHSEGKESNGSDIDMLSVILAVVLSVVGLAIIFGIIIWGRKKRIVKPIQLACSPSAIDAAQPELKIRGFHSSKLSIVIPAIQEANSLVENI